MAEIGPARRVVRREKEDEKRPDHTKSPVEPSKEPVPQK